jgi:xanthine dehydrogenase YagR molybdenum-binding subunit
MTATRTPALGAPLERVEAREKVTGKARYAFEYQRDAVAYAWIVTSTVAHGRVRAVDASAALAVPGTLAVVTHENAPRLQKVKDGELAVLQTPDVSYRGQIVAAVVAETLELAREASALVRVEYDAEAHDVVLSAEHPSLYTPAKVNPAYPAVTDEGDFDGAFARAEVQVDETYTTPAFHNNPMEPHATLAIWDGEDALTLYDSNQGAPVARDTVAQVLGLDPEQVRVIAPHVGGGFGSKGTPRPNVILAAMAAKAAGRPVKLAVTRQQMFTLTGYRTPTIQRLRIGADRDGRIAAVAHDVVEQTSTVREFAEQTATATRMMYGAPGGRRTSHKLARLDVPTPSWMRAPGEAPGMYGLESAMDELAVACGVDPVELRVRNEPQIDPDEGTPFSSRNLVACLREGAERFGWEARPVEPGSRREGRTLIGMGVAASTYPAMRRPAKARVRDLGDGRYEVAIGAADIGTGARTVLTQIAADALEVDPAAIVMEIGDSALPAAFLAGGSTGTASWGSAVSGACRALRADPARDEASYDTAQDIENESKLARHAFGAQFVEVRVDVDTGELRVERLLACSPRAASSTRARRARSSSAG